MAKVTCAKFTYAKYSAGGDGDAASARTRRSTLTAT